MTTRNKLKALTAPCRGVDAEIAATFDPDLCFIFDDEDEPNLAPHYTASLDATVELVEREMPEWNMTVWKFNAGPESGRTHVRLSKLPIFDGFSDAEHTLPAVALLLALLDAKEA